MDMLIFGELRRAKYLVLILLIGLASVEAAAQSAPLRKDIPSIAKAANGAIVTIVMGNENRPIAQGTGFLVSPDGAIATNYHVIATYLVKEWACKSLSRKTPRSSGSIAKVLRTQLI